MHGLSCLQIILLWGLLLDEAGCLDYAATKWMTSAGQWTPSGKYRIQYQTKYQLLIIKKVKKITKNIVQIYKEKAKMLLNEILL